MKRLSPPLSSSKRPLKKSNESEKVTIDLPEIALAAVSSYKKHKEVGDFINYMLCALERNSHWLNTVVDKQRNFKCALLVGAGPNRFQVQETIYPSVDDTFKLEVEIRDSEDYDKIAIAAILKLTNLEIDTLMKFIKTRMLDNEMLREDLLKGKAMGISFAVLRPLSGKQYRVMERITIGSSLKCVIPVKKRRRRDESHAIGPPIKKTRKIA